MTATATGSQTAFVQFEEPAANGGTISGYKVTDLFDGRTYDTTKPGMQIKGLTNGQNHRFTVVATNEAGDSDPSAPSAEVWVDVAPEQMAAPTVVGSDGALTVSWVEPHNEGSRIKSYTVLLNGPGGGQPVAYQASDSQFSMTIPGLKNGTLYSVQVQAQNGAENRRYRPHRSRATRMVPPISRPTCVRRWLVRIGIRIMRRSRSSGTWDLPTERAGDRPRLRSMAPRSKCHRQMAR